MLKQCIWRGQALPCSEIFKTFPTDQGMCCTFNMKKAEEMFQANQYQRLISMMQDQDKNLSFDHQKINVDNQHWKFTENPTPQAGRNKGLKLVLDAHSDFVSGGTVDGDFDGFFAIIDSREEFPTVTRKSVLIRPGHDNIVSIGATKVTAEDKIKTWDPIKRSCLFQDEMSMNVHANYSQSNCLLECAMDYAVSAVRSLVYFNLYIFNLKKNFFQIYPDEFNITLYTLVFS